MRWDNRWDVLAAAAIVGVALVLASIVEAQCGSRPVPGAPVNVIVQEIGGIAQASDEETIVYITRTGKCYHREFCWQLKKSKGEILLREAKRAGKTPCGHCNPPE